MGSRTYEFLAESFLSDDSLMLEEFASISDRDLENELQRYREFAIKQAPAVEAEIARDADSLVVLSDDEPDPSHLVKSALYVNQYIFDDPLLPLTDRPDDFADAMNDKLGMRKSEAINRHRLTGKLILLRTLTPFVAGDFVKFVPSTQHRRPRNKLPMKYSTTGFADVLPTEIMQMLRSAAVVKSMSKVEGGLRIETYLEPCRAIEITFKGHSGGRDFMYMLWEQHITDYDDENGTFQAKLSLPDEAPNQAYFDVWVNQSVNEASHAMYRQTEERLHTAARLNAVVASRSELMFAAMQKTFEPRTGIPLRTANALLRLELPALQSIKPEAIMQIRQQDGDAFKRFRTLLEQKLSTIREKDDPDEANRSAELAMHDLTEVRLGEIDSKVSNVKDKFFSDAVLTTLGLAATVQSTGLGLLSTALALAKVSKTWVDYRQDVKRNPAYFLWKVVKESK